MADSPEIPFDELLSRLRQHDEAANRLLFEQYAPRLLALAQRRLDRRLRTKVDPDDVLQSAVRSACLRLRDGRLAPDGWDGLWRVLVHITLCKVARCAERYSAAKRDLSREQRAAAEGDDRPGIHLADGGAAPDAAALFEETVEAVRHGLTPDQTEVLRLTLEGLSQKAIADRLGCSQSKVSRALREVQLRVERLQKDHAVD